MTPPPQPGTHWLLRGTVHVVDRYERMWDSVHTITEDGNARVYPLPFFVSNAEPATDADLGLTPDLKRT